MDKGEAGMSIEHTKTIPSNELIPAGTFESIAVFPFTALGWDRFPPSLKGISPFVSQFRSLKAQQKCV